MNFRPLHDRVVVKREPEQRKSPGGIVIPDTAGDRPSARSSRPARGKSCAVRARVPGMRHIELRRTARWTHVDFETGLLSG